LIQIGNSDTYQSFFPPCPIGIRRRNLVLWRVAQLHIERLSSPFRLTITGTFEPGAVTATRSFNWLAS
jgi:hypothetical protein